MKTQRIYRTMTFLIVMLWATGMVAQNIDIYFSPNGGAATAVAAEIEKAKTSIKIQAYAISESQITGALLDAHARGVAVGLIVTPTQQSDAYSTAGKLKKAGIHTVVDRAHALQHNKTMVIDDLVVVTGSMNFTKSGDKKNAENTLIIHDARIAAVYTANWLEHQEHSGVFNATHKYDYKPPKTPSHLIIPPRKARR